jgi:hypothetical protein
MPCQNTPDDEKCKPRSHGGHRVNERYTEKSCRWCERDRRLAFLRDPRNLSVFSVSLWFAFPCAFASLR